MVYDLIIAGAGPAGLAAAICAGQLGLRCVILEKEDEQYYKVCGDGLTIHAINALERLGISKADLLQAGAHEIWKSTHLYPDHTVSLSHKPSTMFTLNRPSLLSLLREKARSYGAVLLFNFSGAIDITRGYAAAGAYQGSAFINATGADCLSRGKGGARITLPAGLSGLIQAENTLIDECETHFIHTLNEEYGYCWAFPLGNHVWNVGIWQTKNLQKLKGNFDMFINGWLKEYFPDYRWISAPRGARLGTEANLNTGGERVMFCGDAAGACSIQNGEGISSALDSGISAVEMLAVKLDLCPPDTVEEATLFQRGCPEKILAGIPIYDGISDARKYRLRTNVGDFYARCDPYNYSSRINVLTEMVSVPGIKTPEWYAVDSHRQTTVTGYSWVDGQSLESVADLNTIMNAAPKAAQLLRNLHTIDVSRYTHYRFDFETDYRRNSGYLKTQHMEFPHFTEICGFIEDNIDLLRSRPIALTHQDVRLCNILTDQADRVYLIDIMGAIIADPWSDFTKILVMSDQKTDNAFADALIRCYFDNHMPNEFTRVTALYSGFYLMQYAVSKYKKKGLRVRIQAQRVYTYLSDNSFIKPLGLEGKSSNSKEDQISRI